MIEVPVTQRRIEITRLRKSNLSQKQIIARYMHLGVFPLKNPRLLDKGDCQSRAFDRMGLPQYKFDKDIFHKLITDQIPELTPIENLCSDSLVLYYFSEAYDPVDFGSLFHFGVGISHLGDVRVISRWGRKRKENLFIHGLGDILLCYGDTAQFFQRR
jgi:hypothetical protein